MAGLTTHILDTARGMPADAVAVRLYSLGDERQLVTESRTNGDGRTDEPLLAADALQNGTYEIEFDIGDYFARTGATTTGNAFLDTVVIRINLIAGEHYHVPLLTSPWSYSTYRGS